LGNSAPYTTSSPTTTTTKSTQQPQASYEPSESRKKRETDGLYPNLVDEAQNMAENYQPGLVSEGNGYGRRPVRCHEVERVRFEDKCVDYEEKTCYTQNEENCVYKPFQNCSGVIETKVQRKCFDVKELICGLKESVDYFTLQEDYQVQLCAVVKDRVCDTTFDIEVNSKDDFQCADLEYQQCEDIDVVLKDVTCKKGIDFQCRKLKREQGGYGMQTICDKIPTESCYDTPRTVRTEMCKPKSQQYCQKFNNPLPQTVEKQNCHFDPKKICELQPRTRPRKAKKYDYSHDCTPIPRQICDQVETKRLVPRCSTEQRLECKYEPQMKCTTEIKQFCYKEEIITEETVCDDKFTVEKI